MKISKLFHWLYAILMMLPVFFIGGRMIYVSFNKNAKDSYSGDTYITMQPVYYQSNEVNTINDLVVGNVYTLSYSYATSTTNQNQFMTIEEYWIIDFTAENPYSSSANEMPAPYIKINGSNHYLYLYSANSGTNNSRRYTNLVIDFVFTSSSNFLDVNIIQQCDKEYIKEYLPVTQQETLDNAFIYSINQINTNPLFSWAKDSFLVAPFHYITNLFGVPSDSPINTLLSYWLDISIIYLVFDVVMYVPLLAHRWIDKGMIE